MRCEYANVNTSGVRVAIVGGNWNNDLNAGPFNVNLNNDATNSNTNIGAALSYPIRSKP